MFFFNFKMKIAFKYVAKVHTHHTTAIINSDLAKKWYISMPVTLELELDINELLLR